MDRIAAGTMIAIAALAMTLGTGRDVFARETAPSVQASPAPLAAKPHGSRVLGLLLTLEALRTAPVVLDTRKV